MNNQNQHYEKIEEKILRAEDKKKKKIKVSGKKVFELQRIIKDRVRAERKSKE